MKTKRLKMLRKKMLAGLSFGTYLNYFRWLGLCPVVFNHTTKSNPKTLFVIFFLHIILVTLVVIIVSVYNKHIFFNDDSFGKFNDTFLFAVVLIAYYAIIIESYLKRETQSEIWRLITQCHQSERLDEIDQWKLWNSKEFNSYFIGYFTLLILIECYRLPFNVAKSRTFNYWSLYISLLIASRSRHMQYIFYLNIVKRQLHLLFEELKRIDRYSRYNRSKLERTVQDSYHRFLCRRLYLARDYYSSIYEIARELNDAFGWSHLANLAHAFVQISVDCYWLYWNWNTDNKADLFFFDSSFGIISSIVIVYLVFGYTTALHCLIESFSLQLLHEPIIFHAQGCFNLDLSVLGDATAAIATSMVFFIQFTPRYKSS